MSLRSPRVRFYVCSHTYRHSIDTESPTLHNAKSYIARRQLDGRPDRSDEVPQRSASHDPRRMDCMSIRLRLASRHVPFPNLASHHVPFSIYESLPYMASRHVQFAIYGSFPYMASRHVPFPIYPYMEFSPIWQAAASHFPSIRRSIGLVGITMESLRVVPSSLLLRSR